MKLRIEGNSIRLRLNKRDVAELTRTGQVKEAVDFNPAEDNRLVYLLEVDPEASRVQADYQQGRLVVRLPRLLAREWMESDRVGVEGERRLGKAGTLKITVEKDFPCQHSPERGRAGSTDAGSFPTPTTTATNRKAGG
ncbi:MAG TPA: hypothetical protein VGS20_02470 [Candidatus Acidoferrales bacterium]|nr:hypothetical protein [Candidatus Acidoferrales bacterium]